LLFSLKKHPVDVEIPRAQIYSYLGPVLTALACFSILSYIDVVFVKHHFSALSAGYYSTAALIGKTFLFIPMSFSYAMFPKVSRLHARGEDSYALFKRTFGISFFTLAAGVVLCLAFPKPIVVLLIKENDLTPLALATIIPLIRTFGLAMSPFALLIVIIHYNLARHRLGFVRFLLAGVVIHIILLTLFRDTLMQVVCVLFASGILMFLCQQYLILRERINGDKE
jgi:O-antigen/teichoic acid export membrane protein